MYGINKYGLLQYARDADTGSETEEYYLDLAQYVPPFVAEKQEMTELYKAQGYEVGMVRHQLQDLVDQCFVLTATWGLLRWEAVYGITSNLSLSYEQRREMVLAKMRGQGTTTAEMIRSAAQAFSGGEVQVEEDNPNYHIIIRFVGIYGIPRNMQGFISMLEELKPAHLWYTFEYKYVIWNDLKDKIWNDLRLYTWDSLRINEIVPFVRWNGLIEQSYQWDNLKIYDYKSVKQIEEAKK